MPKQKFPLDLGRKMGGPVEASSTSSDEKYYPSLHLDWDKDYEFPDSGEMTVTFVKNSESSSSNKDGKKNYSVSLEIKNIKGIKGKKAEPEDEDDDAGKALDKLKEDAETDESE